MGKSYLLGGSNNYSCQKELKMTKTGESLFTMEICDQIMDFAARWFPKGTMCRISTCINRFKWTKYEHVVI